MNILFLLAAILFPGSAHAYVDPGSGMLIWQSLIAAFGFLIVFFRAPLETIKRIWARIFRK